VLFVLIGIVAILLIGVAVGFARRPRHQAAVQAQADSVHALAARFGWQVDQVALDNLYQRMPQLGYVLGNNDFGARVAVQLSGQWRGVPICAAQLTYATDEVHGRTWHTSTLLVVPRPVPGPEVVVGPQQRWSWIDTEIGYPPFDERFHVYAPDAEAARSVLTPALAGALATDPRMRDRVLFFGGQEIGTLFPGPVQQPEVLSALGDLLVDVGGRAGR
jgi:hypothetical protein